MLTLTEPFSTWRAPLPFITDQGTTKTHELTNHILHPSPAPWLRSEAVTGCACKGVAQVVLNRPCVTDGDKRKFPYIRGIINMKEIITILRIVVCFKCRDQRAVEGLRSSVCSLREMSARAACRKTHNSIIAEAESRSNTVTRAYQTVAGDTTNAPLSIPGGRIMTWSSR